MRKTVLFLVAGLLGLLIYTGVGKYARAEPIEHNLEAADVPRKWWDSLATLEMLGALGIVVGLVWPPLLVLTCVCLVIYFGGAAIAHLKAGDMNVAPSGGGAVAAAILAVMTVKARRG